MGQDDKSKNIRKAVIIIFFVIILLVGFIIFDDYTEFGDEQAQRTHSLVTYQYLNQKLFGRTVVEIEAMGLPDLDEYVSKQYGVTLQLPLVFVEDLINFTMPTRDIYLMRHLYNFLVYYVALIAFFFLIKDLLKNEWLALSGTFMMYFFPQFFGSMFVNNKDLLFVSVFTIACFFMVRMLTRKRKIGYSIFFAVSTALGSGIRILGVCLLLTALLCMFVEDLVRWRTKNTEIVAELGTPLKRIRIAQYFIVIIGTLFLYVLFMPASWTDPVGFSHLVVGNAIDYEAWDKLMPFAGQNIFWNEAPWYYLPVSMGITIPIFNLVIFFVGIIFLVAPLFKKNWFVRSVKNRHIWVIFGLFLVPFLFQIIAKIKIYLGWRHMYTLYVPICVLTVYGIQQMHSKLKVNKIKVMRFVVPIITIAAIMVNTVRIAANHPYQLCMFNAIGIPVADQYYRNGHRAGMECMQYILDTCPNKKITVNTSSGTLMLPEEQKQKLTVKRNFGDTPNFVIDYYRYTIGNEPNITGYKEIHSISIDGYKIASIFKHWTVEMQTITEIPLDSFDTPVDDPNRSGVQSIGQEGLLLNQSNIPLQAGDYVLTVSLTLENSNGAEKIGFIDVQKIHETDHLARTKIKSKNFAQRSTQEFKLEFSLQQYTHVKFRLLTYEGICAEVKIVSIERANN